MMKRMLLALLVLGVFAATAWAAGPGGNVIAVQKNKVKLVTSAAPEAWVKKGAAVKILGRKGTIVEVKADTVSITTTKALSLKVGDTVSFEKIRATAGGC
jgi:hypothetical protein